MRKVFVFALLLLTFNVQAQLIWEYKDSLFTYKVSIDTSHYHYTATAIGVYTSEGKEFQHILVDSSDIESEYDREYIFKIADANFDGHNDIGIQIWWSTRGDREFQFWFYDVADKSFKIDTTLNDIMNPVFNPEKKLVCHYYHSGGLDGGYRKYIWKNKKLVLIDDLNFSYGFALKHKKNWLLLRPRDVYKEQGFVTHTWLEEGEMKETFFETDEAGIGLCGCE